ncbi:aldo/keto reductase [Nordella sp. HKS 07]|uniref:aldo/keto reductase n=1 Tax=Nordella sp. HKS 07 TaxID=2712222 RepID=UPI0013E1A90A|nr:aldo/keto reductase [Nordella sp. HKS 07]QIG48595.1 aldo/keto reductase [Nordella sp. HKS 07]
MNTANGIPFLGYGTYPLTGAECRDGVAMALDLGIRHIDTAQLYDNEKDVGQAVARSGLKRDEIFLVTKVARDNLDRRHFTHSVEESLDKLGVEQVDLLLIHWPPAEADFDQAIDALCAAQASGLARQIGVSNFTIALMKRAAKRASHKLVNNQVEFHPLLDQSQVKAEAEKLGMVLSAYSPLGRGAVLKDPVVLEVATRLKRPPSEIALRWIIQQGVVAVPMTTRRENARSNMRVLDFELSPADMARLSQASQQNRRLVSPLGWAPKWD